MSMFSSSFDQVSDKNRILLESIAGSLKSDTCKRKKEKCARALLTLAYIPHQLPFASPDHTFRNAFVSLLPKPSARKEVSLQ
ncbi:hypothetical protein QTP88_015522 [Uroleucon formosanum]